MNVLISLLPLNWAISAVDIAPDESSFVTGDVFGTIIVRELPSAHILNSWTATYFSVIQSIRYNHKNDTILIACDMVVQIWSLWGTHIGNLLGHTNFVWDVNISRDGLLIASCTKDGILKLWDAKSLATLHTLTEHVGGINSIRFVATTNKLVSGGFDGIIRLWNDGKLEAIADLEENIYSLACDSLYIVAGLFAGEIWLLDLNLIVVRKIGDCSSFVSSVAFVSKQILSASSDGRIILWDDDDAPQTIANNLGEIYCAAVVGSTMVVGPKTGEAHVFDRFDTDWQSRRVVVEASDKKFV